MLTGSRKIKNKRIDIVNLEDEYLNLIKSITDRNNIDINYANRILKYTIDNKSINEILFIFNYIKSYLNETTYTLMIKYFSKNNIYEGIKLFDVMKKNNIIIKKRTVMPVFESFCESEKLKDAIVFFRKFIKNKYKLVEDDYTCILNLIFKHNKYIKTIFKSIKKNIRSINTTTVDIIIKGTDKNNIKNEYCEIQKDKCNNVLLSSIDLKENEKIKIIQNMEQEYIKDKQIEIERYKKFLDKNKDINVLLDGANIMLAIDRKIKINGYYRINTVYQKLIKNGYKPLIILHQRHIDYLEKNIEIKSDVKIAEKIIKNWEKNNCIYFTPYQMNDDWFFIYGSIYKNNCNVVTNDQLRDHKFKVSYEEDYEDIFSKWTERRLIRYTFTSPDYKNVDTLKLNFPSKISNRIQKINGAYYFSITDSKRWLVIYLKNKK